MRTREVPAFGALLRQHRQAAGLTQEELAERARLSVRAVTDLERGARRAPRKDTVALLAEALVLAPSDRVAFEAAARRHLFHAVSPAEPDEQAAPPAAEPWDTAKPLTQAQIPYTALPTGMLTFLIADVRGYTAFTHIHGDEAGARLAASFAVLADAAVRAQEGQVVEVRGDEVMAVFTSARHALRAAVDLLARCAEAATADLPLRAGLGLDVGEPVPVPGSYRGEAINTAARLCAQAGPGEVLASDAVVSLARRVEGLAYEERGELALKGLSRPVRSWLVRAEATAIAGASADSSEATAAHESRLPDEPPLPVGRYLGAAPDNLLVARETELARLVVALDAARAGQGRLVLLAGEPGIGKTRLAQEVMLHARAAGCVTLVGHCYEEHGGLPFFPFREALASAWEMAPPTLRQLARERYAALGYLLPEALSPPPREDGEEARLRVLRAVEGFLVALAAVRPLVLLLDDLHWADHASLDLLRHLARAATGTPLLLLGTYRDVEVGRQHPLEAALTQLRRERLAEVVALRTLTPEGTAALIGAHFGIEAVSEELRDLVHARTEGNPFFTEEVLTTLVEQGVIYRAGDGWQRQEVTAIAVPESVKAVVGQRVGRLPEATQETLRTASVLGQEFDLAVLVAAAGQPEAVVLDQVEAALTARLLEERRVGRSERYAFSHALIAQTLYDEVPRFRLRRLHLRAAAALAAAHGEQPKAAAELARHWLAGGDDAQGAHCAELAGDHAAGLYAHAEAVQHYQAVAELLDEAGDVIGAARVREKLGVELRLLGRYDAALTVLDQAAETWRATGDLTHLGRVMAVIGSVYFANATPDVGVRRLQDSLPLIEARGPSASLVALYQSLGSLLFVSGRYPEYLTMCEDTISLAQALADGRLLAQALMSRGNALQMLGRVEEALRATEQAIVLAQETGDLLYTGVAGANKGVMHIWRGELDLAAVAMEQAVGTHERLGDPMWMSLTGSLRAQLFFLLGRWDRVRTNLEQALIVSRQLGQSWGLAYVVLSLGRLDLVEGNWSEASRYLEEASTIAARAGDTQALRWAAGSMAELEILQGHPDDARDRLAPLLDRQGLEEFDVTLFLPILAWAYLELGDVAQAEHTIQEALSRVRPERLQVVLVDVLRVQALIAGRQSRLLEAEAALEEGLALARAMPYPYAEARLLYMYGSLHAERTASEPARQHLEAALAIFQHLGARKDVERAEQILAALPRA